jgi:Na+-driven multidrug efflux pump
VLFMPLAWLAGPVLGFGLTGIWVMQTVYRVLQAGIFSLFWMRGDWARVAI